jgi:triosephosphate isomerase
MPAGKPRGVLIAGNWKMNHGVSATQGFFSEFSQLKFSSEATKSLSDGKLRAWAFPPMISLQESLRSSDALSKKSGYPFSVGAQNVHWEKSGAFTGEISGPMLTEIGISRALTGHSERRQYFGETNETVRKRSESLLLQGFEVILCVGETRKEREENRTFAVLQEQLTVGLGLTEPKASNKMAAFLDGRLIIAYEPVWAIGTGLVATPEQAEESHQVIRKFLWDQFGMEASGRTPILYGGSVTPENSDSLLKCANIDGALVGGASLKPAGFAALLEAGARAL